MARACVASESLFLRSYLSPASLSGPTLWFCLLVVPHDFSSTPCIPGRRSGNELQPCCLARGYAWCAAAEVRVRCLLPINLPTRAATGYMNWRPKIGVLSSLSLACGRDSYYGFAGNSGFALPADLSMCHVVHASRESLTSLPDDVMDNCVSVRLRHSRQHEISSFWKSHDKR